MSNHPLTELSREFYYYGGPPTFYFVIKKFEEEGGQVYLKFISGPRAGTIGRVNKGDILALYKIPQGFGPLSEYGIYYRERHTLNLRFDDRPEPHSISLNGQIPKQVEILLDYNGPTVWILNKQTEEEKAANQKVLLDNLGREIKIGSFCSFVYGKYGNRDLLFGKLVRRSHIGTMWFKPLAIGSNADRAYRNEMQVDPQDMRNILIIDSDLVNQIVLAKLAS